MEVEVVALLGGRTTSYPARGSTGCLSSHPGEDSLRYPNEHKGGQTSDLRWFELDGLPDSITLTTSNAVELLDAHQPESG